MALLVHVGPVLVGLGVQDVILEVDAILREDGNDTLSALGEVDLELPGRALSRWDVVGDVLRDRVVKLDVPQGIGELRGVCVELQDIRAGWGLVVVEVGLEKVSIVRAEDCASEPDLLDQRFGRNHE